MHINIFVLLFILSLILTDLYAIQILSLAFVPAVMWLVSNCLVKCVYRVPLHPDNNGPLFVAFQASS